MSGNSLLDSRLARWLELRQQGQDIPAEELCADCPELRAELERQIHELEAMESFLGTSHGTGEGADERQAPVPRPIIQGYEILGDLGHGGMGVVYKARQLRPNRLVALKMILAGAHASPRQLARFRAEAEAAAQLQHPNIVPIYEVGEEAGCPFFSLELVEGGSLDRKLAGAPQPPREAAALVETLARAMHYAHERGIIHRDLKPANVLLQPDPQGVQPLGLGIPKITDFGVAKRLQEDGPTGTFAVVGTLSYMAPEQARGKSKQVGPATDVYALGAILYEMLTGRPPFQGDTAWDTMQQVLTEEPLPPRRLQGKVPTDLETICLKCLRKEPCQRYASTLDLAEDLRRSQAGEPISAWPVGRLERGWRCCRRNPAIATLTALVALALLTGTVIASVLALNAAESARTAQGALEKLEVLSYFDKIALADQQFQANNLPRAVEVLAECPEALRGWEWHYLNRLYHASLALCGKHQSAAQGVAFSPDGMQVASWGRGGVLLCDATTGRIRWQLPSSGYRTMSVAWGPSGTLLASGESEGSVRLWDPKTGKLVLQFRAHTQGYTYIAFDPQGRLLASAGADGVVKVWDTAGRKVHCFKGHKKPLTTVAFHPRKPLLASGSEDRTVKIWDLQTRACLRTFDGRALVVHSLAFHPDGGQLAVGTRMVDSRMPQHGAIALWDIDTGERLRELVPRSGDITGLAFSTDGQQLVAACSVGLVRRWQTTDFDELSPIRLARGANGVAYGGAPPRLATADDTGAVKLWDAGDGQGPRNLRRVGRSPVTALAVHPAKREVAYGDRAGLVEVLDLDTGARLATWPPFKVAFVWRLAYSPDGEYLAAARLDGTIQLGRRGAAAPELLSGHRGRVYGVAFSPDSKRLVSAGKDGELKIWDPATRQKLRTLTGHAQEVRAVAVNHEGTRLASVALDRTVRLWDPDTGRQVKSWVLPEGCANCVALSPDGKGLVTGGDVGDSAVRFWDAAIGAATAVGRGHKEKVTHVAFSPDGKRVVSASDDGTVRLWEPRTGRLILTLNGHRGGTTAAAFSGDGRLVLSGSWDGAIRVWDGTPWVPRT